MRQAWVEVRGHLQIDEHTLRQEEHGSFSIQPRLLRHTASESVAHHEAPESTPPATSSHLGERALQAIALPHIGCPTRQP
jgi:hypothetical protein